MTCNIPITEKKRVVIVGGGFGGLKLSQKLVKSDFQVVLVDRNNYHQFPPLIYQVASSGIELGLLVTHNLHKWLYNKATFLQTTLRDFQKVNQ